MVARREVHGGIDRRRVLPQHLLDEAQALDELAPVGRRQQAQAADAVADGHLVGRLLLGIHLHHVLDGVPRLGQVLLDPGQRQGQRRALPLQPAHQLGDERTGHRRLRARHVGDAEHDTLRVALGSLGHPVGPVVGQAPIVPFGHDSPADGPSARRGNSRL
ncbi:hypothetical protein D3C84_742130 [compost metagenome]